MKPGTALLAGACAMVALAAASPAPPGSARAPEASRRRLAELGLGPGVAPFERAAGPVRAVDPVRWADHEILVLARAEELAGPWWDRLRRRSTEREVFVALAFWPPPDATGDALVRDALAAGIQVFELPVPPSLPGLVLADRRVVGKPGVAPVPPVPPAVAGRALGRWRAAAAFGRTARWPRGDADDGTARNPTVPPHGPRS